MCTRQIGPKAVFSRMPEVSEIITNPFGHGDLKLGLRYREGRVLAKRAYDEVVVLPGSLKSALVPFFARIKIRTGFLASRAVAYSTTFMSSMKLRCL